MNKTDSKRFWNNVNKNGPVPIHMPHLGPCWLWTAGKTTAGYGMTRLEKGNNPVYTHRHSWEESNGSSIPVGMKVCHNCDNPQCVRPSHLFLGTAKQNIQDALKKGRLHKQAETLRRLWRERWCVTQRGENHPLHKLTEVQVREIRSTYQRGKFGYKRLTKRFGISFGLAQRIVSGKAWPHLWKSAPLKPTS